MFADMRQELYIHMSIRSEEEGNSASAMKKVDPSEEHDWVQGETETASIISKPWFIWVTGPR